MKDLEIIKRILMKENVEESIKMNEDVLFDTIPGLEYEKCFKQNNPYHIYDVWTHTVKAISNSEKDFQIRLVLLLHDIGKIFCYQDDKDKIRHFKGHEKKSAQLSTYILKNFDLSDEDLQDILFLIENHTKKIEVTDINNDNIEIYNKLLSVQLADTKAHNPKYNKESIQYLEKLKEYINNKKNDEKRSL